MTVNTDQARAADSVMACPPVTASLGMRLIGDEEVATITLTQHDQAVILHCADQAHAARIAAAIEALPAAPAVQGEVGEGVPDYINDAIDNLAHDNYELSYAGYQERVKDIALIRAYIARTGQPAEQQPAPDVAGLVEALEAIQKAATHESIHTGIQAGTALGCIAAICDVALAAHRKQGGEV